jgi:rubredoxin
MATCPSCGASSRTAVDAISVERLDKSERTAIAAFNFAAGGIRIPSLRLRCELCGWTIDGWIDDAGENFIGVPATERRPDGEPASEQ